MTAGETGKSSSPRRRIRWIAALAVGGIALSAGAIAWGLSGSPDAPKALGCIGSAEDHGLNFLEDLCEPVRALRKPLSAVVSPDGKYVYVVSYVSHAVVILDRNPTSGALTQRRGVSGCVSATGTKGVCQKGRALLRSTDLAISPNGKNIYVASAGSNAVAVFDRDRRTGQLSQKPGAVGCIAQGVSRFGCRPGKALASPMGVVVSPDGRNVYVSSEHSSAVAVFDRDRRTGQLSQKHRADGCISEYRSDGCSKGRPLSGAEDVKVSPEGKNVYVVSFDGVAIFNRNPETGALRQSPSPSGCISEKGTEGMCRKVRALDEPRSIALSPDGANAYVASEGSNAIAVFDRDRKTGALKQRHGIAACIAQTASAASCQSGRGLEWAYNVAVSPDGENVYATSAHGLTTFDRQQGSGALSQKRGGAGCIVTYLEKGCLGAVAVPLFGLPYGLAESPDGRHIYVITPLGDGAILTFDRSRRTGRLSAQVGEKGVPG